MRVIAIGQQKGGVGKSCAACNLACQAVAAGESAVIIDMDAGQDTAIKWGSLREGREPHVMRGDVRSLPHLLAELRKKKIKWAFVDLPGRLDTAAGVGISQADLVLIPCRPLPIDVDASISTMLTAQRAEKPFALFMNIVAPQTPKGRAEKMAQYLRENGQTVAPVHIMQRLAVPDAMAVGMGVNEYAPKSAANEEFRDLLNWVRKQCK